MEYRFLSPSNFGFFKLHGLFNEKALKEMNLSFSRDKGKIKGIMISKPEKPLSIDQIMEKTGDLQTSATVNVETVEWMREHDLIKSNKIDEEYSVGKEFKSQWGSNPIVVTIEEKSSGDNVFTRPLKPAEESKAKEETPEMPDTLKA